MGVACCCPCAAVFNDPEVMAAVNDVASNSQNMKKYKNNAKVGALACRSTRLLDRTRMSTRLLCVSPVPRP